MTTSSEPSYVSKSSAETEALGAGLGKTLKKGDLLLLSGELGSGKTVFIRGLARGIGVADPGAVHSPSYTLVNRYPGDPLSLTHIDAYFMRSGEDLDLCGFEEALEGGDVVAIEWADRLSASFPARSVRVHLVHGGEDIRRIFFEPPLNRPV